ncbi:MAG TPA: hypothetical protein VLT59_10685 [Steroidobacteraceae bacterium]|nr:hypothetical protein [Steroidobacteraceae bacterium]
MSHSDPPGRPRRAAPTGDRSLGGLSIRELDQVARAVGHLLDVERANAETRGIEWLRTVDPQGLGFEAFAVGAIERMCELAMRAPTGQAVAVVRYVAALIADDGRRALARGLEVAEILAQPQLGHFRDAGRRSVDACLACETSISFYCVALRDTEGQGGN